ncbi:flagellar hook-associated protein FlgL [Bacillus lacus]|uniref:Flagellar hook-associated protein FlgL n=1 Tax=Metabacillus lacus TaxID=1983721 RepID=A0A7X2LZQ1_9BACI|nr:flagellar hook-associated protein FlgL [Metabacillus lacus]MRX72187.1 flagellar hook-associated protein FlgL [Metabacillus lacus]
MRVTQGMLAGNSLRHLSNNYSKMDKYMDQLATNKKITRPSDDPVVAMKGMFYRTNLSEVEQYKRNLSEVYQWMENSESGIEHSTQVLHRVRELVVQAQNGTNSPEDLNSIKVEITQLKEDLANVANTKVAGRYIYNGNDTSKPPVTLGNPIGVSMDTGDFTVEVSKGVQLKANVNPINAFGGIVDGKSLFATLESLETALGSGSLGDSSYLDLLDQHFSNMSAERSDLGARHNRLDLISDRVNSQEIIATRILSDNEDADVERVITNLKTQESVLRASLSASARIIQPTLMDFLR